MLPSLTSGACFDLLKHNVPHNGCCFTVSTASWTMVIMLMRSSPRWHSDAAATLPLLSQACGCCKVGPLFWSDVMQYSMSEEWTLYKPSIVVLGKVLWLEKTNPYSGIGHSVWERRREFYPLGEGSRSWESRRCNGGNGKAESWQQYFWGEIWGRCSRSRSNLGTTSPRPLDGRWQDHCSKLKVKDSTGNTWSGVGIWVFLPGKEETQSFPSSQRQGSFCGQCYYFSELYPLIVLICFFLFFINMGYTRSYYLSSSASMVLVVGIQVMRERDPWVWDFGYGVWIHRNSAPFICTSVSRVWKTTQKSIRCHLVTLKGLILI